MRLQARAKIVFAGDSITDSGRRDIARPYGDGYVAIVRSLLLARYPGRGLRFVNRGIAGNTSRDLLRRWERDVLAERPDWLSVMIGINDVWRAFDNPRQAVSIGEYESSLRQMLNRAREAAGPQLVLMTPYMIEPERRVRMREMMDEYGSVVARLAEECGAVFVDTQAAFDRVLAESQPTDWSNDQIHPNMPGHAVIALAWLGAVGVCLDGDQRG